MTRLQINTPLFRKLTKEKRPTYLHRILLYLRSWELIETKGITTREVVDHLKMNYNTANTVLHRMKSYEYISGKKTTVTKYRFCPLLSFSSIEETVIGNEIPDHIRKSDIIESNKKKLVIWKLTNKGLRYAKHIWHNPKVYNLIDEHLLLKTNLIIHRKYSFDMFEEKKEYYNEELNELYFPKDEVIYVSHEEYNELLIEMNIDPKEKIKLVMHNYFKKHEISYIHYPYNITDFDYSITKRDFKTYKLLVKEIPISENPMMLTIKEKNFLEKDEGNQICMVTSMYELKPRVITFLSLEKEEEDKDKLITELKQENLMLKMDLKMLEGRIKITEKLYNVALRKM